MKPNKEIANLEKRMKTVEDTLGLSSNETKNIHLLLTSMRMQGKDMENLYKQLMDTRKIIEEVITQRDKFLKDNKLNELFGKWAKEEADKAKAQAEAAKVAREATPVTTHALPKAPAAPVEFNENEREMVKEADGMIKAEDKKPKQIVTEDKSEDANKAIEDSKKEVVND